MQVRPVGPPDARIMVVGEAPGEQEILRGEPFVGKSGEELSRMLHEAGITRAECFITNVVRERPPSNNIEAFIPVKKKDITSAHVLIRDRMALPVVAEGAELLRKEIELVKPNLIVAFGNVALWMLTGRWGITRWRGSLLECTWGSHKCKVLPTYHPAAVLRQWSWRPVAVHDLRRAARETSTPTITRPNYQFIIHPSFNQAARKLWELLDMANSGKLKLAVDLETKSGHIACLGIAWSKLEAICIPFMTLANQQGYWNEEEEVQITWGIWRLLAHENVEVVGQNFLYDAQYFHRRLHFIPRVVRDTMIGQHALFPNLPKGLDFLSSMYCESHVYWKDEGKEWDPSQGEEAYWAYNCKDAVATFEVDTVIEGLKHKLGLAAQYDFQQSLFMPVLETMLRGVRIDKEGRRKLKAEVEKEISERKDYFAKVLGHHLNPRSSPQMQTLFYDDLKQPVIRKRSLRNGRPVLAPTCDDAALTQIATREPLLKPLIVKIAEFRSLGVFLSTFIQAPLDEDERMRCSFAIAGTVSLRFKSAKNAFGSGTNLQNIPKGEESEDELALQLPNIRRLFVPDPDHLFFDMDLSKADLRIVVWEADETGMKKILAEGGDPYLVVAREYFKDPTIQKGSGIKGSKYDTFKRFCHGTHYLGQPAGLAKRLGLTVHEADKAQKWYFGKFPKIKKYTEDLRLQVEKRRYVTNVWGYRLNIFDKIEGTLMNEVAAWKASSTVSVLINKIYVAIANELPEAKILLQVHDSLAGQFHNSQKDLVLLKMKQLADIPLPFVDPCRIPIGIKISEVSWGDCE